MAIVTVFSFWLFVFFKQKTAYEMRISDWSSDVCSLSVVLRRKSISKACFRERWCLASRDRRREVRMTTSIGAVLRSTGLATIDRALLARAEKPRVKVWAGSIAVGHASERDRKSTRLNSSH